MLVFGLKHQPLFAKYERDFGKKNKIKKKNSGFIVLLLLLLSDTQHRTCLSVRVRDYFFLSVTEIQNVLGFLDSLAQ